jgi:hypothetical protein
VVRSSREVAVNDHTVALGRLGGLRGGPARAAVLPPERRSEIAREAALARWSRDRVHRMREARELSEATGADVGILEHALRLDGMRPVERLAQGLVLGRMGGHLRDRVARQAEALKQSKETGVDAGLVEQVLFMQTLTPREKLDLGLRRSRLGRK